MGDSTRKGIMKALVFYYYVDRMMTTTIHLFIDYIYAQHIWKDMGEWMGLYNLWSKETVKECLEKWSERQGLNKFKNIPFPIL
jgi:hypothetical protein